MKLNKVLSQIDVFCISTGAMLSGLFLLPGLAYRQAGPAVLVSFSLAGLLAMMGLLSQAELALAMPKAGGTYFYVTRSMGPGVGTVYGLITWLAMVLKSSYELLFLATFVRLAWEVNEQVLALDLCAIFIVINLFGIKKPAACKNIPSSSCWFSYFISVFDRIRPWMPISSNRSHRRVGVAC